MDQAERILRYPDGAERRIRYPAHSQDAVVEMEDDYDSWGVCREGDKPCENDVSCVVDDAALPGAAPHGLLWADEIRGRLDAAALRNNSGSRASVSGAAATAPKKEPVLPSSPAALLAFLQSPAYREEQQQMERQVSSSFVVLTGCPWLRPKPVFVLATRRSGQDHAATYTLPTRSVEPGEASELARIVGAPGLASSLNVERIRDGVVCFEEGEVAAQYREFLEADGYLDVLLTEVDSHELFRTCSGVDAVVVLLGQSEHLPRPHQLAAALRGRTAMDDFA